MYRVACVIVYFNSRPSARGDVPFCVLFSFILYFNSRPSARGDPPPRPPSGACCYFNSRPSARGDARMSLADIQPFYFNSRPSARGDHRLPPCHKRTSISIHAPPRGATRGSSSCHLTLQFQFTPLREGRPQPTCKFAGLQFHFNSRPSARGDLTCCACWRRTSDFNSRPSARGDCRFACCFLSFCISIHAPPRGATN